DLNIILISASDDESPLSVAEYARWIDALVGAQWHKHVFVSGLYPRPAARLDELFPMLQEINTTTSIDSGDYRPAFASLGLVWGWGGANCLDAPVDVDPETAGLQYDCSLSVLIDDQLCTVPRCGAKEPGRAQMPSPACFSLESAAAECGFEYSSVKIE